MFVNSISEIEAAETAALPRSLQKQKITCFHCGTHCRDSLFTKQEKTFCCGGCLTVFELLTENGLENFYALSDSVGVRIKPANQTDTFGYLDEPVVRQLLVDFTDERITRVTFRIPSIHCIACVWLLENLFRLQPGIGESQVNFLRKEVAVTFENSKVKLGRVVELLTSLGYEPDLKLANLDARKKSPASRRLWLQIGIAGFAFGNNHTQFNQSPLHKLEFIHARQRCGKTVMMVGDGLNDSGALQQSDVGVAVVENIGAFSPASDIIMDASLVPHLHEMLRFSRRAVTIVRLSFLISTIYNVVGISIAARGLLSPVVCAILMPLSSVTVVAFACGVTTWIGKRTLSKLEKQRRGIHNDRSASSRSTAPSTKLEVAA